MAPEQNIQQLIEIFVINIDITHNLKMDKIAYKIVDAKNLNDDEVEFELRIRGQFDSSHNKIYRRQRLNKFIADEVKAQNVMPTSISFDKSDMQPQIAACREKLRILRESMHELDSEKWQDQAGHIINRLKRLALAMPSESSQCIAVYNELATLINQFKANLQANDILNSSKHMTHESMQTFSSKGDGAAGGSATSASTPTVTTSTVTTAHTSIHTNTHTSPRTHTSHTFNDFMRSFRIGQPQPAAEHNSAPPPPTTAPPHPMNSVITAETLQSAMQQLMAGVKNMMDEQRRYFAETYGQPREPRGDPTPNGRHNNRYERPHINMPNGRQDNEYERPHTNFRNSMPNADMPSRLHIQNDSTMGQNVTIVPYGHTPVAKWPIRFSGMSKKDDPKSIDDVTVFIERVEELMDAHRVNNHEIMEKLNLLLLGPAHVYLRELKRQGITDWSLLKQKFLKRFANLTEDNLRSEIYSRRQKSDERTLDYIFEMCGLISRLPVQVDEHTRIQMVLRGLDERVAQLARARAVNSIDQLSDYIVETFGCHDTPNNRMASQKPKFPYYRKYDTAAVAEEPEENSEFDLAAVQRFLSKFSNVNNSDSNKRSDTFDKSRQQNTIKCWNCDQEGHGLQFCPRPKTHLICYGCGQKNVTIQSCPQCGKNKSSATDRSSEAKPNKIDPVSGCEVVYDLNHFFITLEDDPRPHTDVKFNGIEMNGLLDTGAHITVLGYDKLDRIEKQSIDSRMQSASIGIRTADGSVHKAMGIVNTKYEYNNRCNDVMTIIMSKSSKKLLLGIDFMHAFNIRLIDWHQLTQTNRKEVIGHVITAPHVKQLERNVQAASIDTNIDASEGNISHRQNRGQKSNPFCHTQNSESKILWEFIIETIASEKHSEIIRPLENQAFRIVNFRKFVSLWAKRRGRTCDTPEKMERAIESTKRTMRHYNRKGEVIVKVPNQKDQYRFIPKLVFTNGTEDQQHAASTTAT